MEGQVLLVSEVIGFSLCKFCGWWCGFCCVFLKRLLKISNTCSRQVPVFPCFGCQTSHSKIWTHSSAVSYDQPKVSFVPFCLRREIACVQNMSVDCMSLHSEMNTDGWHLFSLLVLLESLWFDHEWRVMLTLAVPSPRELWKSGLRLTVLQSHLSPHGFLIRFHRIRKKEIIKENSLERVQ